MRRALAGSLLAANVVGRLAACEGEACDADLPNVELLQRDATRQRNEPVQTATGPRDLVFMHVPYNFGHTVEKVAAYGPGASGLQSFGLLLEKMGSWSGSGGTQLREQEAREAVSDLNVVWGHVHPLLQEKSNVTGCPLYYTPQKHWPEDVAKAYFGDKKVFGLLRDPYERLTAFFRGNMHGYGFQAEEELVKKCDVNAAVKTIMKKYIAGDLKYNNSCSFVPQAEYWEGPHGISVSVDNRYFPDSMNKVFVEHGYNDMEIRTNEIFHVMGCNEVWSGDFDEETRALVRQVYQKDFDLICKLFGHCDPDENTCLRGVPMMCPQKVLNNATAAP